MSQLVRPDADVEYPEDNGEPLSDNTTQLEWIVKLYDGLQALFGGRSDVFVTANLLWYPVRGNPLTSMAPDVMVVFGRGPGHRGSYKQWEEGGVGLQVVFEVLSPSNTAREIVLKRQFYARHGVEEYYVYDPLASVPTLEGYCRDGRELAEAGPMAGFVSPRLGVTFEMGEAGLRVLGPDGRPFVTAVEREAELSAERRRADDAQGRAARLAARLRELGVDPDSL